MDRRLSYGGLGGGAIQEGTLGLDVMSVGGNTWTSPKCSWLTAPIVLDPQQRSRLDRSQLARDRVADSRIMHINYYPRESHLVTFRDPWSFPVLFHPGCNHLVRKHLEGLAQKVTNLQMKISRRSAC